LLREKKLKGKGIVLKRKDQEAFGKLPRHAKKTHPWWEAGGNGVGDRKGRGGIRMIATG